MSNHNDLDLMSNDLLRDLFLPNHDYKVNHLKLKDQSEDNFNFELEIRVNVKAECKVITAVTVPIVLIKVLREYND